MIEKNNLLPLPPAYHELSQLLFMLEMSYINLCLVDAKELKCRIDVVISAIHANNILESINFKKS